MSSSSSSSSSLSSRLCARLTSARSSGRLDVRGQRLSSLPASLWCLHEGLASEGQGQQDATKWWNIADLKHIDMSDNALQNVIVPLEADEHLASSLVTIIAAHNQLQRMPENLERIVSLTHLNLNHNALEAWTNNNQLDQLTALAHLTAHHNLLTYIPSNIDVLTNLEYLDLSDNRISGLPDSLSRLGRLLRLNLSGNCFTELPSSIGDLTRLTHFECRGVGLQSLPASFSRLTKLKLVDISLNCLQSSSACESSVPVAALDLVEVKLSFNRLSYIGEWSRVLHLRTLDLSNNAIQIVDDRIASQTHLAILNLSNNNIDDLPANLGKLESLHSLQVSGNPMRRFRSALSSKGTLQLKQRLRNRLAPETEAGEERPDPPGSAPATSDDVAKAIRNFEFAESQDLVLRQSGLSHIPVELAGVTNLRSIDLSFNSLTDVLPEDLFLNVGNTLTHLQLQHNQLTALPSSIGALVHLSELDLSHNRIRDLPFEARKMGSLTTLDMSYNLLKELPLALDTLSALSSLNVENNALVNLKGAPACLRQLFAANNSIIDLPNSIVELMQLEVLDLSNNSLSSVPLKLAVLPRLNQLRIHGNCLRSIRTSLLMKGGPELIDHIRRRVPLESSLMVESEFLQQWVREHA